MEDGFQNRVFMDVHRSHDDLGESIFQLVQPYVASTDAKFFVYSGPGLALKSPMMTLCFLL